MQQLKWLSMRIGDKLGLSGLLALFLAVCMALFVVLVRWPLQHEIELQATQHSRPAVQLPLAPESSAIRFIGQLPRYADLQRELKVIFDTAEGYGLELNEVSYRKVHRQGESVEQYLVDFDVQAPYPETRAFLQDVMVTIPSLSLEQLSMTRENIQQSEVNAHMRLSLFLVR